MPGSGDGRGAQSSGAGFCSLCDACDAFRGFAQKLFRSKKRGASYRKSAQIVAMRHLRHRLRRRPAGPVP